MERSLRSGAPGWEQWLRLEVAVGVELSAKNRGGGHDAFGNSKDLPPLKVLVFPLLSYCF